MSDLAQLKGDLELLTAYHDGLLDRRASLDAELREVNQELLQTRIEVHIVLESLEERTE